MAELLSITLQFGMWIALAIAVFMAFSMFMRFMLTRQRRNVLLNFRHELNKLKWAGADEGWELAIKAVRERLKELAEANNG